MKLSVEHGSKVLHSFKVWMFRSQVKLTSEQKKRLEEVVLFAMLVYLRVSFVALVAVSAPAMT